MRDPFGLSDDAALVRAEALMGLGEGDAARAALARAHAIMMASARTLDGEDRTLYLGKVSSNVRLVRLVEEWHVET